jgi:uncharacterized protein
VQSRIYNGWVAHERKSPKENRFRYRLYYAYLDLDEIPELAEKNRWFSHNASNLVSFWDKDHGPRDSSPLRPWIDDVCSKIGVDLSGGRVRILTFPRVLGFKFYPVAFWYCYSADGVCRAVLAEVQNTFGDHHNYLLHSEGRPVDFSRTFDAVKVFHVSPFIGMADSRYRFRFTEPGEHLRTSIFDEVEGSLLLVASIDLQSRPFDDAELVRTVTRLGPISARAWLLIHFQALRIIGKGIRYIPRPAPPQEETTYGTH